MRIVIIFTMVFLLFISGCQSETIKELKTVEVREYEGERLDSIADFRENSIKGPQYVDKDSYKLKITGLVENEKTFTYDEVISSFQNYRKIVRLDCVEGWSAKILCAG